jgi:hypothetical protein
VKGKGNITGNATRVIRFFLLTTFGLLLAPRVFAVPIPAADTLTIFNPNHTVFRSIFLTPDQIRGGATAVLAVSLETVPDASGSLLPLLDTTSGVEALIGHGMPFPAASLPRGTRVTRVFGIFSLEGSLPGALFFNFATGHAITRIGSPGEFSLVSGTPIDLIHSNPTRTYDATQFLSFDARTAGYTATFQNGISDTGPSWLLLALAIFATAWFGRRTRSEWS